MSGLFGTFNISTRGLSAQQKAIDTTSHNISNANTEGYSRQRVTFQASKPFPMPGINAAAGPGQIGTGVDVTAIDRIRDLFLDYQVRAENAVSGQFTGRDKFLSEIENIMNEPTDTGLSTLIGKFFDSWNTLATSASKSNAKSIVAQQSLALSNELNHSYTELESLKSSTQTVIKDTVFDVNSMLGQLNQVNQQIIQVKVAGNAPNDLMDRRDLILDNLSKKFGITLSKRAFEGFDVTTSNESKYASTDDNGNPPLGVNGKPLNLAQAMYPDETMRFSYIDSIVDSNKKAAFTGAGDYAVTYYKNGDKTKDENGVTLTVHIDTEDEFKQLDQCRVLWANNNGVALKVKEIPDPSDPTKTIKQIDQDITDAGNLDGKTNTTCNFADLALFKASSGEFKGYMSVQKDIDTYENQLNKFAKSMALSVNAIISQSSSSVADGTSDINNFFVNADKKAVYSGTDSTAITSAEQEITAANITVNAAIMKDPTLIKSSGSYDANGNPVGDSDGKRALAVEMLRDSKMKIQDVNTTTTKEDYTKDMLIQNSNIGIKVIGNDVNGMTLDSYFKDIINTLGIQEGDAKRMVSKQELLLASFKQSRDSVSGVSLDEEMANLIQYQHCYQANAKVIATVDELLDVVVNGLKK